MTSFAEVVHSAAVQHQKEEHDRRDLTSSPAPTPSRPGSQPSSPRVSSSAYRHVQGPNTPSTRTGPPRSISFNSLPNSRVASRSNSNHENGFFPHADDPEEETDQVEGMTQFRGALEYDNPEQRSREREFLERIGRKRDSKQLDESWNPLKWLTDTPKEEKSRFDFGDGTSEKASEKPLSEKPAEKPKPSLRRSSSVPDVKEKEKRSAAPKWRRLRSLLPNVTAQSTSANQAGTSALPSHSVNITDELITGGLSTLMLRLWFERDEKGHRRVPILLHRLRVRISDSLHPLEGNKAVFRIECEYANGAARWVIYRQLKEFLSLHAHYAVSNAYNRNVDTLPEFPRTSLPYLKFLKKEGKEKGEKNNKVGHADFTRLQREALENYLVGLIRAVMFHPTLNRLAGFLEISALSISLAQSGGAQYKAGYLRLKASGSKGGGFGPKAASRISRQSQKWCAVRESYLVVVEELAELTVYDVFLIDSDFKIQRPTRYYRQGLHLLHTDTMPGHHEKDDNGKGKGRDKLEVPHSPDAECMSTFGSMKSRVSHVFRRSKDHQSPEGGVSRIAGEADDGSSSSSSSSGPSRPQTPLLDPSTNTNPLMDGEHVNKDATGKVKEGRDDEVSKHTFYIENAQMRLKLFARNERQMLQWIAALEKAAAASAYTQRNRFDSFAPIRLNVAAQWLVDGRDYFWNLSRAIQMAKECIYIHDWWLSPELQLRRPLKDRYRLDHLLQRKAQEGVKIYIIVYHEVSSRTTPVDSNYTKQRMMGLHDENIMVQRSPSHFQTGTFYWAHHEKLCVIDQAIAFMGGVDLCFGRWDTPQHVLNDDPDSETHDLTEQIWPGKDYSNGRVSDFHTLTKPFEDMYDRTKVPRMPWHDVGMQVVGQPARDLARHFVERWNYLLRIKNHSRRMPCLLPPPEFQPNELARMGLTGTCEMQVCRSAGPWSLGTPDRIEHSIQNAYLKSIQMSEHFVYIENQFFITSTVVADVKIENKIGDALVDRIIRARNEGTTWKCCIVIPLLPGFPFPLDHGDASSIRIILECQNRTICRGPNSIFGRLRKEGIDPDDYISIFSLRNWGKMRGNVLTTEQVYIHGKVCIVDDRLAIIGSANINERSQSGDRDSELAAIIRDTDMLDGTMAGKPFKVGRFAHTLRVRLMREHLGVDVDNMHEDDLMAANPEKETFDVKEWDPEGEQVHGAEEGVTQADSHIRRGAAREIAKAAGTEISQGFHAIGDVNSGLSGKILNKLGVKNEQLDATGGDKSLSAERTTFTREGEQVFGFTSSMVPTLEEKTISEGVPLGFDAEGNPVNAENADGSSGEPKEAIDESGDRFGAPADASKDAKTDDEPPHMMSGKNDADEQEEKAPSARANLRKHLAANLTSKTWTLPTPAPTVDSNGFDDPVSDAFWRKVWVACAVHNTEIYRKVFHAVPDDLVTTWKQYKEFIVHHERLNKPAKDAVNPEPVGRVPSEAGDEDAPGASQSDVNLASSGSQSAKERTDEHIDRKSSVGNGPAVPDTARSTKKTAKADDPFEQSEREEMEKLLGELCGHLVVYPTRFLEGEDIANNFLFNADRLLPLPIYN